MKFLAFVSRAQVQARYYERIAYGPTNRRAVEHLPPERVAMLPAGPAHLGKVVLQDVGRWSGDAAPGKTNLQVAVERWERWITSR